MKNLLEKLKERVYGIFNSCGGWARIKPEPIFVPGVDVQLTKNFRLSEFVKSEWAIRYGLNNWPENAETVENLRDLCISILQPIRDIIGKPIRVNSGFRTSELNILIKGADNSQHMKGEAADIEIVGMPNKKLAELIQKHIPYYDQLILEFWYEEEDNSGWVHVSFVEDLEANRGEELTTNENGVFIGFRSQ